jgi:transcriptional regulator with XRE-family HTH domain
MVSRRADAKRTRKSRNPTDVAVGARLRSARLELGWTLPDAAKRLGWSRLTVINHEQGDVPVSEEKLARYATVYDRPAHFLRYGLGAGDATPNDDVTSLGQITPSLPEKVRVWIYEFLTELVRGGASEREVQQARALLTGPSVVGYLNDPTSGALQLTEEEMISALEQVGKHVIKRVLRKRGRRV